MCGHRHGGQYPLDKRLGIQPGQMRDEGVKVAALLGVEAAYGSSREGLCQTTLLELSPNSIRKACHLIGNQVEARQAQALSARQDLSQPGAQRREMAQPQRVYASMDDQHQRRGAVD